MERTAQIVNGDKAYIKIKKKGTENAAILYECYKVSIEKTKDKIDVTQFPYQFTNYIYINKPEIKILFESYTVNEYIEQAIRDVNSVYYFNIEIYKDNENVETYNNMILTSSTDTLDVSDVEKYSLEFTKSNS